MTTLRLTLASLLFAGAAAQAAVIGPGQIAPSTSLPYFTFGALNFTVDQLADGIDNDQPVYNGFASNGIVSGRITLTLDQAYNLSDFVLWNDVNVSAEGVRTFELTFLDGAGQSLGSTGTLSAVSQVAPQTYSFGAGVNGVKTVQLDVYTSSLQIEIRELAFNGVSAVPEPATIGTMLAGLAGVFARIRARRLRRD